MTQNIKTIDKQYVEDAKIFAAQGITHKAWQALAAGGDNYALNAAMITDPDIESLGKNIAKRAWVDAESLEVYNQKFDLVAKDHLANYIDMIEDQNHYLLPTIKSIEISYNDSLKENGVSQNASIAAVLNTLSSHYEYFPHWTTMLNAMNGLDYSKNAIDPSRITNEKPGIISTYTPEEALKHIALISTAASYDYAAYVMPDPCDNPNAGGAFYFRMIEDSMNKYCVKDDKEAIRINSKLKSLIDDFGYEKIDFGNLNKFYSNVENASNALPSLGMSTTNSNDMSKDHIDLSFDYEKPAFDPSLAITPQSSASTEIEKLKITPPSVSSVQDHSVLSRMNETLSFDNIRSTSPSTPQSLQNLHSHDFSSSNTGSSSTPSFSLNSDYSPPSLSHHDFSFSAAPMGSYTASSYHFDW